MYINPISQNINYNKSINFKKVNQALCHSELQDKDSFEQKILRQNQKELTLLGILAFSVLLKIGLDVLLKSKDKPSKYDLSAVVREFKSLKDDASIPTLDSCKSMNKDLKIELQRRINYMKAEPDKIAEAGKPIVSNRLLLYGSAGVGKSYFAKVLAKSTDAEYMEILFSDFNSRWVGEGVENLKSIFESILSTAKNNPNKKYVVTLNEIDTMVQPIEKLLSSNQGSGHYMRKIEERSLFLNYLEMLKEETPNVTIIGTTNVSPKNNNLDRAALSRFQNLIEVPYPDADCLYEALKNNLTKVKGNDKFISENDKKLKSLADTMAKRKFSFRNLEYAVNDAKTYYLDDSITKKSEFKFEYLQKGVDTIKLSDGELEFGAQNLNKV